LNYLQSHFENRFPNESNAVGVTFEEIEYDVNIRGLAGKIQQQTCRRVEKK
jgi:hypothetical protein